MHSGYRSVHIRLSNDITAFRCDHDTCTDRTCVGTVDGLEEASRDTSRSFDPWSIIIITVIVRRAVLDPVALQIVVD